MARERIEEAGLTGRITVHNMDFREIVLKPEWKGAFDRFISVEMMEHVGKDFMKEYWSVVDWALKPKTAVGVVQVITIPESRTSFRLRSGQILTSAQVFRHMTKMLTSAKNGYGDLIPRVF